MMPGSATAECLIDGCPKRVKARGWCGAHYEFWRLHGDPLGAKPYRPYGQRGPFPRPDGYVEVYEPEHPLARKDGRVQVHRKMAWDAGMFDDPALQVHHVNEVRDDNRLENFEILSVAEHARRHARERGTITNQYGTFPVRV